MAHILIGGDSKGGSAVISLLRQWGMTSGRLPERIEGLNRPTISECDAVILVQPFAGDFAPAAGGPPTDPPSPLLLLGTHPGRVLLARDAQQVVSEPGPSGANLKVALEMCLERTKELRGYPVLSEGHEDRDGYLRFLGHELRSPLTAAKTALEVLQGELGGLSSGLTDTPGVSPPDGEPPLKMLDIALRNIKRLHRTVDWRLDLLEMETLPLVSRPIRIPVKSLAEDLGPTVGLEVAPAVRDRFLEIDPKLLRVLTGQLVRVLDIALPECPVTGELVPAGDCPNSLEMVIRPMAEEDCFHTPRVARTHLTPVGDACGCGPDKELERLAGYVVSAVLLDHLKGRVQVRSDGDGVPSLVLQLKLSGTDIADMEQVDGSLASLRQPA